MLKQRPQASTSQPRAESTDSTQALKFEEVQDRYQLEVEKGENWTEKTKAENLSIFALFARVMSDLAVDKIDRKMLSEYKATLMKLPPNLNKTPEYKDKTIEEIVASKPAKTLTENTLNKYIRRLSGLYIPITLLLRRLRY